MSSNALAFDPHCAFSGETPGNTRGLLALNILRSSPVRVFTVAYASELALKGRVQRFIDDFGGNDSSHGVRYPPDSRDSGCVISSTARRKCSNRYWRLRNGGPTYASAQSRKTADWRRR